MFQGRIVESGGHAELLARGGKYAELWARQAAAVDHLPYVSDDDDEGPEPRSVLQSEADLQLDTPRR